VNALIQYADPLAANGAKMTMNMKNLYEGCGVLKIQDSPLKDLTIEFNNEKSWDFTTQLPPGAPSKQVIGGKGGMYGGGSSSSSGGFGSSLPPPGAGYGNNFGGNSFGGGVNSPLFHPGASNDFQQGSPVVLVSNLNEKVTTDMLFALFSCYGDVQRVKILFNKRDNALIQFANPQQAATAQKLLHGTALKGKNLQINISNKMTVTGPQNDENSNAASFNKDFSNSEFHRFKIVGSKNFQNISPPSATLHISNIAKPDAQQGLKDLFQQYGNVVNFKTFPNNDKMALIQMGSVAEGVEALVNLHLYPFTDSSKIRVSFSKSTIQN